MRHRNHWYAAVPLLLLFGSGWLWTSRPSVDASTFDTPRPAVQHPAPDFSLPRYSPQGEMTQTFTLSSAQGTPVVLNFWATWCGPCRREFPALQAASARYGDDLLILGVDQGESPETIEDFLATINAEFPIVLDRDLEVGRNYNVRGLPTTYFIDANGIIRSIWAGEMNSIILAEKIAEISNP